MQISSQLVDARAEATHFILTITDVRLKPLIQSAHVSHDLALLINGCGLRKAILLRNHFRPRIHRLQKFAYSEKVEHFIERRWKGACLLHSRKILEEDMNSQNLPAWALE